MEYEQILIMYCINVPVCLKSTCIKYFFKVWK